MASDAVKGMNATTAITSKQFMLRFVGSKQIVQEEMIEKEVGDPNRVSAFHWASHRGDCLVPRFVAQGPRNTIRVHRPTSILALGDHVKWWCARWEAVGLPC